MFNNQPSTPDIKIEPFFGTHIREVISMFQKTKKFEFPCLNKKFICHVGWGTASSDKTECCSDKPENCVYFSNKTKEE